MMSDVREIELAVEHFASNQEFIRLYNRHNRELLLQHFLLIAAAGNDVWTTNQERKMSMPEQRDLMLVKYMEWLEKLNIEFPEVEKPFDVSEDWWRLMLLAYERKPISGKSLWRKFKEDTRNPILSSFNCHWVEPREGETMDDRFRVVRRGVWSDLGHRDDEFLQEGSWLPKQWYAWRFCCYPGKNFRAFDGKLPSVPQRQRNAALMRNNSGEMNNGWGQASLPIDASMLENQGQGQNQGQGLGQGQGQGSSASAALPIHRGGGLGGGGASSSSGGMRPSRSTLPSTVTNQRLLQAAASMSRVRANPEDELNVQHYLADVQQYMAQMTRLEKAATLAEAFGEQDKAVGFKRQLYEHVQTEPPQRLKRPGAHSPVHQQQGPTPIPLSAHNGNGNGNGNNGHSNAHLTPNHNNHNHGNGLGHHQQNNLAIIPIPGMQIHSGNSSSSGTNSLSEGSSGIHQHN